MTGQPISRDEERVLESFEHHQPNPDQIDRIAAIRATCKGAALTIIQHVEGCADRTAALRLLHEAMMTANKAIACEADRHR